MAFSQDGYLSPEIEQLSRTLRNTEPYRQWFNFADELNRFGIGILDNLQVPRHDQQRVTICALFVRAHQSFQAALILAGKGMLSDARVVLRSAVEGAIAMHAIAKDSTFIERLEEAHHADERQLANLVLNTPDYKKFFSENEITKMERTTRNITELEKAREGNLRRINWADEASKYCKDLYNLLYRLLSSNGTHTNITTISRFLSFDNQNTLAEIKIGPDIIDMVQVMQMICLTLLWAADPFTEVFQMSENREILQKFLERFPNLPNSEPTNVTINPNYT